jgi:hypothetical protein
MDVQEEQRQGVILPAAGEPTRLPLHIPLWPEAPRQLDATQEEGHRLWCGRGVLLLRWFRAVTQHQEATQIKQQRAGGPCPRQGEGTAARRAHCHSE